MHKREGAVALRLLEFIVMAIFIGGVVYLALYS